DVQGQRPSRSRSHPIPVVVAGRRQRPAHGRPRRNLLRALEVVRLLLPDQLRRSRRSWLRRLLAARAQQRREEQAPAHLLARGLGTWSLGDGELAVELDDAL